MPNFNINSILGGISNTFLFGQNGSYLGACGIDPEEKIGTTKRISGTINTSAYEKILNKENILWIVSNDLNNDLYFYTASGEFGKINNNQIFNLGENDTPLILTNSSGNGLAYYNNYYYIAKNNNVDRFGPIDGIPKLESDWWTKMSEEEGDFVINAFGSFKKISFGGINKISQSVQQGITFNKLFIALRNVGQNTNYKVKVSIQGIVTETLNLGTGFTNETYTIERPDGNIIQSSIIENISNLTSIYEFNFLPFEAKNKFCIVIETELPLVSGQDFDVVISDFGNKYENGMLSFNDTAWKIPIPRKIDNRTIQFTATTTNQIVYQYQLFKKENTGNIKGRVRIRFTLSTDQSNYSIALRINDLDFSSNHIVSNRSTYHGMSTFVNQSGEFDIDLLDSLNLKNGDIITIRAFLDSTGHITIHKRLTFAYTSFYDETEEEDMGFKAANMFFKFPELGNVEYPLIGNYKIPNHSMHIHSDSSLYFCDVNNNTGVLNKIKTGDIVTIKNINGLFKIGDIITGQQSKAKGTIIKIFKPFTITEIKNELMLIGISGNFILGEKIKSVDSDAIIDEPLKKGIKNMNSEANVLDLENGINPVSIISYGKDLLVSSVKTFGTINQGNAKIYLWDTFDPSFYRDIELPYPFITAMLVHNGRPFIWGGDNEGYSLSTYDGGSNISNIHYIDNGYLPLQGAVDAHQGRIIWGSSQDFPEKRGAIMCWGSKVRLPSALHNIGTIKHSIIDLQVSALKVLGLNGNIFFADQLGINFNGGLIDSIFSSEVISFGQSFEINSISFSISRKLLLNENITIKTIYDNEDNFQTFSFNHLHKNKNIKINPKTEGSFNMYIQIEIKALSPISVMLPIRINYNLLE